MNNHKTSTRPKVVEAVYPVNPVDYHGLITYTALPASKLPMERLDPFIFLNHHGVQRFGPNNKGLPFGPHPHKGFETVTFIVEGDLVHKDSTGFESNIKAGGVQWMTAGRGIIHSEQSSAEFMRNGGNVDILQLWVNLPARLKSSAPNYIGLQKDQVPDLTLDNGSVTIHLVSGLWEDRKAPILSLSDVHLATVGFKEGGTVDIPVPGDHSVLFYVIKGNVTVNGASAAAHNLVVFGAGEQINVEATSDALILFGHAAPTNEPIVARGPFVMNTQAEIDQAYQDFQQGKFGGWNH
ncbi:pirin family protein [Flaviaesturariibacter flavus]|uniref:Pirin family protein n=1 Tax=Flaviaesturariibacter flavus TaxID=2502780 RepID=A0A4R1BBM8_9BACT|nr:pirin family protein [Flaviaesturariibacter flavus]TCJ14425.1 pirin family protein [Flaviaesturariibacter flavus]